MDGFVTAHLASDGEAGRYTMAYFKRDDIPFHWALADAFTICDGYHCSMMGPTWPNRLYLMTGQVDPEGANGGPVYSNYVPPSAFSWTTYPDPQVPGDPGDYNYASTAEAIAVHGSTLYLADTGTSEVSVIDSSTLDPSNYNPAETDIHVGLNPQDLAVTPDGSQLWVADTGPQTAASSPTQVSVIAAATDKVTATIPVKGAPSQVAFSPSGATAYVVTADGLWTFSTATRKLTGFTGGLGDPRSIAASQHRSIAVSPDGKTLYVTDTDGNSVKVISASTGKVTATVGVGELPWQVVVSADGKTAYVANPDFDSVSVIDTTSDKVTDTIAVTGDPDTLALTPDGSQLWVGQRSAAYVTVIDTSGNSVVGSVNLGGSEPQSGDGYTLTGIALVSTPTPGS